MHGHTHTFSNSNTNALNLLKFSAVRVIQNNDGGLGCSVDILHAHHGCRDETTGHLNRQMPWRDIKMSARMTKTHGVCDLTCDERIITAGCYSLTWLSYLWTHQALRISSTNLAHNYTDNDDKFVSFQSPPTPTKDLTAVAYTTHTKWTHATHRENLGVWKDHATVSSLHDQEVQGQTKAFMADGRLYGSWIDEWFPHITTWHNTHTKGFKPFITIYLCMYYLI